MQALDLPLLILCVIAQGVEPSLRLPIWGHIISIYILSMIFTHKQ